ncbi:MAG: hypothetical protein ACYCOR_12260 [Acidobacteriaceae bacterium]
MRSLIKFPGFYGIEVGIGLFLALWMLAWLVLWPCREMSWFKKLVLNHSFDFELPSEKGAFEKLLANYLDIAKVVIGLASGSIVLLVGSASFRSTERLQAPFASPLYLLALSTLYAVFFMVFETMNYEDFRHGTRRYSRLKYSRNIGFGFGSLLCFCFAYMRLVFIVTGQ